MAKKNKKSAAQQQKRQQKKQQRRSQRVQNRGPLVQQRAPVAQDSPFIPPSASLLNDVRPLFGASHNEPNLSPGVTEELLEVVWHTEDLLAEEELAEIGIAPMAALNAYLVAAQAAGIDEPEALDELAEAERDERLEQIMGSTLADLLTNDLRTEIVDGLEALRHRWRKEGRLADVTRAAAAQLFLSSDPSGQTAPGVGLIRAMLMRDIEAGFALMSALEGEDEPLETIGRSPREIMTQISDTSPTEQMDSLLQQPGMESALNRQLEQLWEQGRNAITAGELVLDLYDEAELLGAIECFRATQDELNEPLNAENSQKFTALLWPKLQNYVTELMTAERLVEVQERLDEILDDPAYGGSPHVPFLMMLREDVDEDDAAETDAPILTHILFCETQRLLRSIVAPDETDDNDADDKDL